MKKVISLLTVLLGCVLLVACSSQHVKTSKKPKQDPKVHLIVTVGTNQTDEWVTFEKGETIMAILKANYDVKEKNGFITAIDGAKQDVKAGKYWLFKVNGKLASKAANRLNAKDGDKVEFYQEIYKNKKSDAN